LIFKHTGSRRKTPLKKKSEMFYKLSETYFLGLKGLKEKVMKDNVRKAI